MQQPKQARDKGDHRKDGRVLERSGKARLLSRIEVGHLVQHDSEGRSARTQLVFCKNVLSKLERLLLR